jgi:excisionase family DNA binding protein
VGQDVIEERRLLKAPEVCERLQVSRSWLYESAQSGRIPAIRLGGSTGPLRFIESDIDRWLEQARSGWTPGKAARVTSVASLEDARRASSEG